MTTDNSTVAEPPEMGCNDTAQLRNAAVPFPDTKTAHANLAVLLSLTRDAGYAAIAAATGHDKSWVARFFTGETRASLPEILRWMDVVVARITALSEESKADRELMQALLAKTSAVFSREAEESGDRYVSEEEFKALLQFAKIGIQARMDAL